MKNDGSTTKDNRRKELLFLNIRIANNLSIKPTNTRLTSRLQILDCNKNKVSKVNVNRNFFLEKIKSLGSGRMPVVVINWDAQKRT